MRSRLCTPAASSATGALAGSGDGAPNCSPCRSTASASGQRCTGAAAGSGASALAGTGGNVDLAHAAGRAMMR